MIRYGRSGERQVQGDIRHLESRERAMFHWRFVHGDIRHLEKLIRRPATNELVHGDIRHLEKSSGNGK